MTKKTNFTLFLLSLLLLTSCADRVHFWVDQPPEIPLQGIHSLKVGPVDVDGQLDLMVTDKKGLLSALGNAVANEIIFNLSEKKQFQSFFESHFKNRLSQQKRLTIKEKSPYDVETKVTIHFSIDDEMSSSEYKNSDGVKQTSFQLKRSIETTFSSEFLSPAGTLIHSDQFKLHHTETAQGSSKEQARRQIADWQQVLKESLKNGALQLADKLSPSRFKQSITLQDADNDDIEEANEKAAKGHWEQALETYRSHKEGKAGDAAHHNLGVYYESHNQLDEAMNHYLACEKQSYCQQGIQRIEKQKADNKMLKSLNETLPEVKSDSTNKTSKEPAKAQYQNLVR